MQEKTRRALDVHGLTAERVRVLWFDQWDSVARQARIALSRVTACDPRQTAATGAVCWRSSPREQAIVITEHPTMSGATSRDS
jgi:hypothetical protein